MNLQRLYNTVKFLKPVQVTNRMIRRIPHAARIPDVQVRPRAGLWVESVLHDAAPLTRPSKLRTYTLHYHHRPDLSDALAWISTNPPAGGPGWEPYPLSRRITNWIKWLDAMPRLALESLATQSDYLFCSVEHHLLGNHLFANAKALVFSGVFFMGAVPARWLARGLKVLESEIREQILDDGGHVERSPMYHSLILEDMLDLVNLSRAYPGLLPNWSETASRMLAWLEQMIHPDGEISFFNDSAFGVAPPPAALRDYAARLDIRTAPLVLSDSGYVRLENATTVVLFDAAPIGPDYQPGHAHADTLSFELSHAGRRLIANSGTSTYENNQERQNQRGTAAHNTIRIDGRDQSEVWAAFRVARRARPMQLQTDGRSWAEAAHDGYKPVIHRRRLNLLARKIILIDSIEGSGDHRVEIFFHLHPGVEPNIVSLDPALARSVQFTRYHPQFDVSIPNETVCGCWSGLLPAVFETEITLK